MTEPQSDPAEPAALVVIGASAGGIEALSQLLRPLAEPFPTPIVVAQHTQPTRTSHLAEVLARRTKLPVLTVLGRLPLVAGTVYIVPADHHVLITDHAVEAKAAGGDRPSPSIDRLLASAAEAFGERLIAVILSGMGSDGVVGAGEVKARGGTVIIQNPDTAAQPAMPRALPPTLVDFVANADAIGELVVELAGRPTPVAVDDDRLLSEFLERVRERTGIDFSAYKRPTVLRRLHRRMIATANPRLRDYARYVEDHPDEYQRLASAFLIKVTEFFRDGDLFDHLREVILPALIDEARGRDRELRIWSAGCATGEEAYSLAILVGEALGDELDSFTVRIFATDLDEDAIAFARRGIFPAAALQAMSAGLLERWFVHTGDQYEVAKPARAMVVFGQHDLGQRAPFPRIDIALCRNVLIYFTPELQKRALQLFAFSLREGGFLVLGKAESTTPFAEHFVLDQPRLKVYRRAGDRVMIPPAHIRATVPMPAPRAGGVRREGPWAPAGGVARSAREIARAPGERADGALLRLPVGVVVVDRAYDISFINAEARRMLGIHGEAIGSDFIHLANQLPSDALRAAIGQAIAGAARVSTDLLELRNAGSGDVSHVQLVIQPYAQADERGVASVLVTLIDMSATAQAHRDLARVTTRAREDEDVVARRLDQVSRSHRELLAANEEMTNANAMLQLQNLELLVANEEVQAATEEVETLNEELQATNEELETLNEELQATVEELNTTNDDLEARSVELAEAAASLAEERQRTEQERERLALILDGMGEAVLVVDADARVVATNRAYDEQFGQEPIVPQDAAGADLPEDEWPQHRAARGEVFSAAFTRPAPAGSSRRWYEATGRGSVGDVGGVIVIRDITDRSLRHLQERFIDAASHELQTPLAALHTYLQLAERELHATASAGDAAGYLDRAIEQSRLLGELASRLFDASLIRHGRAVVGRAPVNVRDVIVAAVDEVRAAMPEARIHLRLGRRSAVVLGDQLRLRQMFTNLIRNAVTHGASSRPAEVSLTAMPDGLTVCIADRGPGVPPAVRSGLFAPFAPTGGDQGGLGLGTYLAGAIAREHGGSVVIEPRGGGGTEARVVLPVAPRGQLRRASHA